MPANGVDPAGDAGVYTSGQSNVIRNNYIHDVGSWGVYLDTTSSFNTVAYNRTFRTGHNGIWLHGTGHLVEGNDISRTLQFPANWTNPPPWSDADGIDFEGSHHTLRKNVIHDILFSDPENSAGPHTDCFQISDGGAADIIIEQNVCRDIPPSPTLTFQAGQLVGPLPNLTIRNNIVHNVSRGFTLEGVMNGVKVLNNTFVDVGGSAVSLSKAVNAVVIKNNIFYNMPLGYIETGPGSPLTAIGNNLSFHADGPPGSPFPGDLVNVDPKFKDVTSGNYHLRPNSPAIDAGVDSPDVPNDFDGISRPQGRRTDIGAYEFH